MVEYFECFSLWYLFSPIFPASLNVHLRCLYTCTPVHPTLGQTQIRDAAVLVSRGGQWIGRSVNTVKNYVKRPVVTRGMQISVRQRNI